MELAGQQLSAGRLAEAEGLYRQILAQAPGYAEALFGLGSIALRCGKPVTALESFELAIESDPLGGHFHLGRGIALMLLGRLEHSVSALELAVDVRPDSRQAYYNMALCLKELGRLREAEQACRRALGIQADYAEARGLLGLIQRQMQRADSPGPQANAGKS
jgi:protein O-GlcNAc transferase